MKRIIDPPEGSVGLGRGGESIQLTPFRGRVIKRSWKDPHREGWIVVALAATSAEDHTVHVSIQEELYRVATSWLDKKGKTDEGNADI